MTESKIKNNFLLSILFLLITPVISMDCTDHNNKLCFNDYELFDQDQEITTKRIEVYNNDNSEVPIGHIRYNLNHKEKTAVINIFEVIKQYQNKGIGSQLFLKALQDAKTKKMEEVRWVSYKNSIRFYQRFGAKVHPPVPIFYIAASYVDMKFVFETDGDAAKNLEKYNANKSNAAQLK